MLTKLLEQKKMALNSHWGPWNKHPNFLLMTSPLKFDASVSSFCHYDLFWGIFHGRCRSQSDTEWATLPVCFFLGGWVGWLTRWDIFLRRVMTGLGEYFLRVTRPSVECSQNLVSSPASNQQPSDPPTRSPIKHQNNIAITTTPQHLCR